MRDGEASRRRLFEAATTEFATYGIAGARVDRIAARAQVNKAQLYTYFGDKDTLFDTVLHEHAALIVDSAPLTAEDLPGYAVALYDACLARPELVRLATWARLERIPTGPLVTSLPDQSARKRDAVAAAQESGHIDPNPAPGDVLALVSTMALTWSSVSLFDTATPADPSSAHTRRRTALADAVRGAFAPR